jgi:hypothetical protein
LPEGSQSEPAANSNPDEEDYPAAPQGGSLAQTKKLLLAALRVWELNNGIRSGGYYPVNGPGFSKHGSLCGAYERNRDNSFSHPPG